MAAASTPSPEPVSTGREQAHARVLCDQPADFANANAHNAKKHQVDKRLVQYRGGNVGTPKIEYHGEKVNCRGQNGAADNKKHYCP